MLAISAVIPRDPLNLIGLALCILGIFLSAVFLVAFKSHKTLSEASSTIRAYLKFFYACFVKPHSDDGTGNQQDALESFYKAQAEVYDTTRSRLLHGREDMLALVASQLKHRMQAGLITKKPVWVDIGGGTGHNIEKMSSFLSVPEFFRSVYVVDLSPSLCEMAQKRFERLGWTNVKVVCQDARAFRLHEHEHEAHQRKEITLQTQPVHDLDENADVGGAELVTMSYALSMIPEFYPVIDSISSLLSPNGIIGVCDFYVQSRVDYQSRNYTGGVIDRHCIWISRVFWRTWFEIDRVNLEPARRDYLEYRFGTVLGINARNHFLGVKLPYYVWIGCSKDSGASTTKLAEIDAAATESPYLSALDLQTGPTPGDIEIRSKAYESAIVNLQSSLPLPATWYQNHHWRIHHDESLQKHVRFNNTYIYAFTWEDSRVDARLLRVRPDDVILAITSAGDNILSFALEKPRRIHAVDLNPSQNHLLELKVAAFTALGYSDVWKLFGEGKHEDFRDILINKLSPHMSSLAFQFWLQNGPATFNKKGLYYSGGSGHALQLVGWIFKVLGLSNEVKKLCAAPTLNEQREIWQRSIKRVLHSRILTWTVIGNEKWLWKALGVPPAQRNIIEQDYLKQGDAPNMNPIRSGHAIYEYVLNTFEPVVNTTLISDENHYYLLCLQGKYSRKSHPDYLTPKAHIKLSKPDAFDGLRIHTDEINEVIARMRPGTLTIVVVMDSMDWFPPTGPHALRQIKALNKALKLKGRVLLRSAGLTPWYIKKFEESGFSTKRVGARMPGTCIDLVNMYASTWICTKEVSLEQEDVKKGLRKPSYGSMDQWKI
ncbi:S-adenosyl-L-methionine-dependent methyltransferase [Lepidopterella palustris CBS 459.81]|uniref:S-adenosyl-L-methionine-dependent methyltransferase n=1 Tax=Lepidopterella palustris CBS 459.81 TaxID=1314670 RepID=A0A8E2JI46_9PEZI|nr:S-adenosyl-L-methionine-dependent methyltransferase [Lepidopterella palustris CBS 459.81]